MYNPQQLSENIKNAFLTSLTFFRHSTSNILNIMEQRRGTRSFIIYKKQRMLVGFC